LTPFPALLEPLLLPLLRRDPAEIARRARSFRIEREDKRGMVDRLGRAFLGGYNAMLARGAPGGVAAEGRRVESHYRPFFFEGAATGYVARSIVTRSCSPARAEADLLGMEPAFRYLYYVGLGLGYGFRHAARPEALLELEARVDPLYLPLCFDGWGFKLGFFDFPRRPGVLARLARVPAEQRFAAYQGFGRALYFVYMDDPRGFGEVRSALGAAHGDDLEFGRSLARGFTGVDEPDELVRWVDSAGDERDRAPRLLGITWALTARRMNDAPYFAACMARAAPPNRERLERLPAACEREREAASNYADWQARTRAVLSG
jgi:hypothetical protein